MNKCPEIQRQKQIHLRSNYDHCSGIEINCIASLSLWALHQGWSEQLMECWLLLTLIIDSMAHWPMRGLWGLALTNQRPPSPLYWQPIDQFDVQMLCWDGSDLPGSDPHQGTDPCHASGSGLRKHYSHSVNKSSVKFYLGNLCLVTLLPHWDASKLCW